MASLGHHRNHILYTVNTIGNYFIECTLISTVLNTLFELQFNGYFFHKFLVIPIECEKLYHEN